MGEAETVQHQDSSFEHAPASPRRTRRRSRRSRKTRGRLRKLYFSLAAVWGFLIGTASVLGGLAALGRPLQFDAWVGVVLVVAVVLAVAGGFIAAVAYREAASRIH